MLFEAFVPHTDRDGGDEFVFEGRGKGHIVNELRGHPELSNYNLADMEVGREFSSNRTIDDILRDSGAPDIAIASDGTVLRRSDF